MEKRTFERIRVNLEIGFCCCSKVHEGTITNLSENGMFICTRKYLASDSKFVIVMRAEDNLLKILVRVKRLTIRNSQYDGMGVELVNPNDDYLKYVSKLKVAV